MTRVKFDNQVGIKIGINRFNQSEDEKLSESFDLKDQLINIEQSVIDSRKSSFRGKSRSELLEYDEYSNSITINNTR